VGVFILNTKLGFGILYKAEAALENLWILTLGSTVVVLSIELDCELWTTLDEVCSLVLANRGLVALSKQGTSHILHISELGRISSLI
jgi:hypothetical protein